MIPKKYGQHRLVLLWNLGKCGVGSSGVEGSHYKPARNNDSMEQDTGKPVYNAIVWQGQEDSDYCDLIIKWGTAI
jgi:hypothetical protein